jgi:hypothetical protein
MADEVRRTTDVTESLFTWIEAEASAREHFARITGRPAGEIDVQSAALATLGLDVATDLLDRMWTSEALISLVRDVNFAAWTDYEEVHFEVSILPVGVPRRLDEETIKYAGEKWRIYKYDPDPFPCLPHAHNLFEGIKLDLRNGGLYRKRQLVDRLARKALIEFRERVQRIQLPPLDPE